MEGSFAPCCSRGAAVPQVDWSSNDLLSNGSLMSLARKFLLALSTNAWLREKATKAAFVRRSVSVFMPGETVEDAMAAAAAQERRGVRTIFTRLGENITRVEEAEEVTTHYLSVLDKVQAAGLQAQISVKPTQLGLDQDRELCLRNLQRLVDRASETGNFVWLDMESSPYVDPTIDLFRRVRVRSRLIGIALQAYLYRTAADVEGLLPLGPAIRLVKGAYLEPPDIAFPKKADVDGNYYKLACRMLSADAQRTGTLLHIATHDPVLVGRLGGFIAEHRVPASSYEYAMLYGIQRPLQQRLVNERLPLRVLIAYGEYWFPWYMRRLAERPANVWFVAKNLFAH
jgi:proline dehydrogenase